MFKMSKGKAEHRHHASELQPIIIDLVVCLPRTLEGYDTWIVLDRLTKSARLIPIKVTYSVERLDEFDYIESLQLSFR